MLTPTQLGDFLCRGWAALDLQIKGDRPLDSQLLALASAFGTPIGTRSRGLVDRLHPITQANAHQSSISAKFDLGKQPWHLDLAHRPQPPRYLLFACEREGTCAISTDILAWRDLLAAKDEEAARTEPFLVRTGRSSFYATMLSKEQKFLRFDPVCMQPATTRAKVLMAKLLAKNLAPSASIHWKIGMAVILDNWRLLHRRADASGVSGRSLLRVSVMGD